MRKGSKVRRKNNQYVLAPQQSPKAVDLLFCLPHGVIEQALCPVLFPQDAASLSSTCKNIREVVLKYMDYNVYYRETRPQFPLKIVHPQKVQLHVPFLQSIYFSWWLDHLPSSMTSLSLMLESPMWLPPRDKEIFPSLTQLKHLTIRGIMAKELNFLPSSLQSLDVEMDPNSPQKALNALPANLISLSVDPFFNDTVDFLPPTLTTLKLGAHFNKEVNHLPPSLTSLAFGVFFNQPVDNLPATLTSLMFGNHFAQPVNKLPSSLSTLTMQLQPYGKFPTFNDTVDALPASLTHLTLSFDFDHPIDNLPPNLKFLQLGDTFNQRVPHLPPSLTELRFGECFNQPLTYLPRTLRLLVVAVPNFAQPLDHLPPSVIVFFRDEDGQYTRDTSSRASQLTHAPRAQPVAAAKPFVFQFPPPPQ